MTRTTESLNLVTNKTIFHETDTYIYSYAACSPVLFMYSKTEIGSKLLFEIIGQKSVFSFRQEYKELYYRFISLYR